MASTSVVFDILANDRASSKFAAVGNAADHADGKMSKFGSALRTAAKVGAVALVAGVGLAAKGLVNMTQAAIEDEAAQVKLANTLRNTAGATDAQVASVEKWISAQGKAFGVADDDLRPALQRLAEATGDVTQAQDLASLAMDVSAGTGKSLKSVSEALMKAQNGMVSGLSRLGIETKNAKGETLTFEEATAKMAKTFDGQAAKAADTTAGKLARFKLMLSETGEEIGGRLIPFVEKGADFLADNFVPALEAAEDAGRKIGKAVEPAISEIAEALGHLSGEGGGVSDMFNNRFIPALETSSEIVGALVNFVDELPGPVKDLGVQVGVAAIAFNLMSPAIAKASGAMSTLVGTTATATTRMAALSKAASAASGVGGVLLLAKGMQTTDAKAKALMTTVGGMALGFAVGGPAGAAIGGMAGLVLGLKNRFTNAEDAARNLRREQLRTEAIDGYKAKLDGLRSSLDEVTGAYTESTRAAVLARLQEEDMIGLWGDGLVSNRTMVDAVLGHEGAIRQLNRAYNKSMGTVGEVHPAIEHLGDEFAGASRKTRNHADAVFSLAKRLGLTKKALLEIPRNVRVKIRDDVPDSLREIKKLARQADNLDRKTIRILLKAADLPVTKKNIQAIQAEVIKTGKTTGKVKLTADEREYVRKAGEVKRSIAALDRAVASPASTLKLDEYYRQRSALMASLNSIPDEYVNIYVTRHGDGNQGNNGTGAGRTTVNSVLGDYNLFEEDRSRERRSLMKAALIGRGQVNAHEVAVARMPERREVIEIRLSDDLVARTERNIDKRVVRIVRGEIEDHETFRETQSG